MPNANPNLRKCNDCGHQVSKHAESCPHCGAKIRHTSFLALLAAVVGTVLLLTFIGSLISDSNRPSHISQPRQPLRPSVSEASLANLDYGTTYYGVVKLLGPPDAEITATDVPLPNTVMGYRETGWLVYVVYDLGDRTFDKAKTHYLGTITTERVVHASDEKYRPILEGLKDGLKQ